MSSQSTTSLPPVPAVTTDDGSLSGDDTPINSLDPNRWFFEKSRIDNSPSRKSGLDADKELAYRQQAANFIQDIGQRLQVNQLCINTAIVYMHRFYMYHSFTHFHRNAISTASVFLAAKVEEQPRKLDHVIKVSHYCLHRDHPAIDPKSELYQEQSTELVMNENILLQTLGFDVAIDHPHTHVVKCCQLVRASKDLAQTSYFMATNSLHLTTMCLQYRPTLVACVCIHLACKWSSWEIPRSKEGKDWWKYVDDDCTAEQLEQMTTEFLTIFNKSPSRLKRKIISLNAATAGGPGGNILNVPALAGLGLEAFQQGSQPIRSRSRSPSPKRQRVAKPGESHGGGGMMPPKSGQVPPHHGSSGGMKPPVHGGQVGAPKHGHPMPMKPPQKPSHGVPSAKDHHQGVAGHPHYQQQPPQKNPYGHPPLSASGQYRPQPNAQTHHSHSSSGQPSVQQQKPINSHPQQPPPPPIRGLYNQAQNFRLPPPPYSASSSAKLAPSKIPPSNSAINPAHLNQSTASHQINSISSFSHKNAPPMVNPGQVVGQTVHNKAISLHPQSHVKKSYEMEPVTLIHNVIVSEEGFSEESHKLALSKLPPSTSSINPAHLNQSTASHQINSTSSFSHKNAPPMVNPGQVVGQTGHNKAPSLQQPQIIIKKNYEMEPATSSHNVIVSEEGSSEESHKHKKKEKKKHKHKDKDKHKEEKKDKHKDKDKHKEEKKDKHKEKEKKHKHKKSSPSPIPEDRKIKIKLTLNKDEKGGNYHHVTSNKKNSNLRQ